MAFGSKETGAPVDESEGAALTGEPSRDALEEGTETVGEAVSEETTVSAADGAVLCAELQPGFAKIRIRANTWMPTTTPNIFRTFIGE